MAQNFIDMACDHCNDGPGFRGTSLVIFQRCAHNAVWCTIAPQVNFRSLIKWDSSLSNRKVYISLAPMSLQSVLIGMQQENYSSRMVIFTCERWILIASLLQSPSLLLSDMITVSYKSYCATIYQLELTHSQCLHFQKRYAPCQYTFFAHDPCRLDISGSAPTGIHLSNMFLTTL